MNPPEGTTADDLRAFERELVRMPGIEAARVVTDASGRFVEVHVVSSTDHHPKKIVRDVQAVAKSSFDLELDHRTVSVARMSDRTQAGWRPVLSGLVAERRGVEWAVEVTVEHEGLIATGSRAGSMASSSRLHTAALATLDALRRLVPALALADVETPVVISTFHRQIALVTVVFGFEERDEAISGSAVVGEAGDTEAVARAVLDATTRRLAVLAPS